MGQNMRQVELAFIINNSLAVFCNPYKYKHTILSTLKSRVPQRKTTEICACFLTLKDKPGFVSFVLSDITVSLLVCLLNVAVIDRNI